jgi:hypothetical protein
MGVHQAPHGFVTHRYKSAADGECANPSGQIREWDFLIHTQNQIGLADQLLPPPRRCPLGNQGDPIGMLGKLLLPQRQHIATIWGIEPDTANPLAL